MGFNPVVSVDPGPADIAPKPVMADRSPPPVLMTPPPSESPVRADDEEAGTMVPTATTVTAAAAATIASPTDFAAMCHSDATGNVDIHKCLEKAASDADAQLETVQSQELHTARSGSDWKEGRKQAQLLAISAMSFNAYRDSECLRQQQISIPGQKTGDIMLACQVRLTLARIAMLSGLPATQAAVEAVSGTATQSAAQTAAQADETAPVPLTPLDAQPIPAP
jgi:hypothetical protein